MTNDNLIKKVFKSYLTISILSVFAATVGMLVDGIVIGHMLGQECVSALGLASPVVIFTAAASGIFSNGGSACASNYIGRGDKEKVNLNFTVTILGTLILSLIFMAACVLADETIAVVLGARGDLVPHTSAYIRGIGLGIIPTMLSQVVMYYIRLDNGSALSFVSVICMTVCNITMDILFAGVFKLGMFGMGLATSISYLVCLLVCCINLFKKSSIFRISSLQGGAQEIKNVIVTGLPSALNRACMTLRGIILNRLLITIGGSFAVSALAVQNNVNQLLSSVTMGVGMTTMMMAGIFYGERDEKALEKTTRISLKTGAILSTITAVAVIVLARPIVGLLLTGDGEDVRLAVRCLRFFCLSLPFSLSCVVLLNFYQCTKNLLMANIICIGHGLVFVVLMSWICSPLLGTDGVWISFLLAELLTLGLVVAVIRIKKGKWPVKFAHMMMLPDDFTPPEDKVLDISIQNDMKQVMELSERITEFCIKYTKDKDKVQKLSLCIEEMAGNIIQHGFHDKKQHTVDIKIIIEKEDIIFRMRDDGISFNPIQYADERGGKQEDTLGISIIRKIAKNMEYNYAIGMNNLTIIL